MASWPLKYLFIALFHDGSVIKQDADDVSIATPQRSRFYDVVQRLDEVVGFSLIGDSHVYTVDLRDGHFEVDGVPFSAQPVAHPVIEVGGKFELIYFRDHRHTRTGEEETHTVAYRFGWRYVAPDGREYVQTLVVA